jgi:hypothetical protein
VHHAFLRSLLHFKMQDFALSTTDYLLSNKLPTSRAVAHGPCILSELDERHRRKRRQQAGCVVRRHGLEISKKEPRKDRAEVWRKLLSSPGEFAVQLSPEAGCCPEVCALVDGVNALV